MEYSLSVIVPNYNKESYLKKCINSILSQTLIPNEIIIVDDNSTDNSVEIIQKLERDNNIIKSICLRENLGVSNARDIGINKATSKYITVIDSDDYYYDGKKLEKEMKLIKEYKEKYNEDIISFSKTVLVNEKGELIKHYSVDSDAYYLFEGDILSKLFLGIKIRFLPRDYCFLKELYVKCDGYDKNISLYEDLDLLIRLANISRFYCSMENGTAYRQNTNGLSNKKSIEHSRAKKMIYKKNRLILSIPKRITYAFIRNIIANRAKIKQMWSKN